MLRWMVASEGSWPKPNLLWGAAPVSNARRFLCQLGCSVSCRASSTMRGHAVFRGLPRRGAGLSIIRRFSSASGTISEVISDLEHGLGVKLLDRSAQGVEPTMYGHALLSRGLAAFDELTREVAKSLASRNSSSRRK